VETRSTRNLHPRADDKNGSRAYISRMADLSWASPRPIDPSLPAMRWARWVGVAVIAAVVGLSFAQHPAPSLTGTGLAVSLSLLCMVGASVTVVRTDRPAIIMIATGVLIVASAALIWLQAGGAGVAGLFVAVAFAGIRLADLPSVVALALAAAAFVATAVHADRSVKEVAVTELGIFAFYLVARFGRSAAEAHQRSEQLLRELQANRNAEAEAAMLRERSRLARDMHDVLAHSLSGLMLQLEGARMLSTQPDSGGQLPPALDRAHHLARAGLEEARRAIAALRDEELPGPDRLQRLVGDFERDSGVPTSLSVVGDARVLNSETSLTVYRVAQEALTNIRKHANPERVEMTLRYDADGTRLMVSDHGSHPVEVNPRGLGGGGYGLTGMRERAELIGGSLVADRTLDGFRVELSIPA
jgi:signal transduction histidine kinase